MSEFLPGQFSFSFERTGSPDPPGIPGFTYLFTLGLSSKEKG
jgi:hypothetical protein